VDEAAPTEAGAAVEKRRPLLRRVPTPLIVTLVGIALTAWLLPAITRQWDDRQQAHDLQAEVVAQIASATGHALVKADQAESLPRNRAIARRQAADAWLLATVPLEARLRAYFPADVVAAWDVYSYFVDSFLGVPEAEASLTLNHAVQWLLALPTGPFEFVPIVLVAKRHLSHDVAFWAAYHVVLKDKLAKKTTEDPRGLGLLYGSSLHVLTDSESSTIRDMKRGRLGFTPNRGSDLLGFQEAVVALVLKAHPTGYSTTSRDLFHELIP
jgi:hypothetical protein